MEEGGAGVLSSEQNSPTMKILESEDGDDHFSRTRPRESKCVRATLAILILTNVACFVWIAVISTNSNAPPESQTPTSPLQLGGPDFHELVKKMEALEAHNEEVSHKFQALELEMSDKVSKEALQDIRTANHSSFAAVRKGIIKNGIVVYNETLHSTPEDSFTSSNGSFSAPMPGTYSFSFSGTSFCSETKVMAQVNGETALRYYDRDSEWKGNGSTYGYFRGWTQNFALQLDVGDVVSLLVDCDSSEASWTSSSHKPGAVKEHRDHSCFYSKKGYFYFLGQFMGY